MPDTRNVATPTKVYAEALPLWVKCRAVCSGEEAVKDHDELVGNVDNFLVPFSPTMDQEQYQFLKREAELPGVVAEFKQLLIGALLRREPQITIPGATDEAINWIINEFGVDGSPILAYMSKLLDEELESTYGWTHVDYDGATPFPVLYPAEAIINVRRTNQILTQVVISVYEEVPSEDSEFHPDFEQKVYVHELVEGSYQVRKFYQQDGAGEWLQEAPVIPLKDDKPLDFIPLWPNNGEITPGKPFLLTLVNKEIALYNKITRRNHLMYSASTYTPYTIGVDDEAFRKIVNSGLGSWLQLPADADLKVLEPPTGSLQDLEKAIATGFEEMAKLGVRMLSPETAQSGTALNIRNASQSAKIGTLNTRVGVIIRQIIALMANWRYGLSVTYDQIKFDLQSDFTAYTGDEAWLRLLTEWYENNLIPRSIWIRILKSAEKLPDDYNDEEGKVEMAKQERIGDKSYSERLNDQAVDE